MTDERAARIVALTRLAADNGLRLNLYAGRGRKTEIILAQGFSRLYSTTDEERLALWLEGYAAAKRQMGA